MNNKDLTIGLSLPKALSDRWLNVYVSVIEEGNKIIIESGTKTLPMDKVEVKEVSTVINKIKL